jgi:hypothetical protein
MACLKCGDLGDLHHIRKIDETIIQQVFIDGKRIFVIAPDGPAAMIFIVIHNMRCRYERRYAFNRSINFLVKRELMSFSMLSAGTAKPSHCKAGPLSLVLVLVLVGSAMYHILLTD